MYYSSIYLRYEDDEWPMMMDDMISDCCCLFFAIHIKNLHSTIQQLDVDHKLYYDIVANIQQMLMDLMIQSDSYPKRKKEKKQTNHK